MNNTTPLVSIIIPVFNLDKYISTCIQSCTHQNYPNLEIIVINDGSTDHSAQIIDNLAKDDTRITPIHTTNRGVTAARFSGINAAKGEFLYFLDGDDTLSADAIQKAVQPATKANADLVIGNLQKVDESAKTVGIVTSSLPYGNDPINVLKAILTEKCIMGLAGNLFKRTLFLHNKIDLPEDILIGEDVCMLIQLTLCSQTIVLSNHTGYYYLQHCTSVMNKPSERTVNSRTKMILWLHHFLHQPCSTDKELENSLSYFILNNWFAYLRDGGNPSSNGGVADIIYSNYLKNTWAKKHTPWWRMQIIKMYKVSPLIGGIAKNIFTTVRVMAKTIKQI